MTTHLFSPQRLFVFLFCLSSAIRTSSSQPSRKTWYCEFRAEERSAQASAHPLSQAQGGLFSVMMFSWIAQGLPYKQWVGGSGLGGKISRVGRGLF